MRLIPLISLDSDAPRPVEIFRVPHYDAIPAGNPREMNPEGQMWMDIVHSKGKDTWYTWRVVGNSISPDYLNGDIVLIDYALRPHDGDVMAALVDGTESALKTYSRNGDEITLAPIETQRHSPRTFHASRITIQGVLIEIVRRNVRRKP
jgi:SOS-response transcriptional repressor LexA